MFSEETEMNSRQLVALGASPRKQAERASSDTWGMSCSNRAEPKPAGNCFLDSSTHSLFVILCQNFRLEDLTFTGCFLFLHKFSGPKSYRDEGNVDGRRRELIFLSHEREDVQRKLLNKSGCYIS